MKLKWGALVVDGRNKIGGHVASKNRAGAYLRTKVTPVNPSTIYQNASRSRLTQFSQAWRALTDAQRQAWNSAVSSFARTDIFGDMKNPSGFNLFQRLNNELAQVGEAQIDTPPLVGEVPAITSVGLTANATPQLSLTFAPTPVPADTALKIYATAPQSPGKNFVKSEYRLLTVLDAADTSPEDILTDYTNRFGAFSVGQKIFVRVVPVNTVTGQTGQGLETSTIVATAP